VARVGRPRRGCPVRSSGPAGAAAGGYWPRSHYPGNVAPLRRTHHSWAGSLAHVNCEWLLPRGYKVIGTLPLLHAGRSRSYSSGWQIGQQLAMQRRWDSGDHGPWSDPREITCTGAELNEVLGELAKPRPDIWSLTVTEIESLDCADLATRYPELTRLTLGRTLGMLVEAASLNRLTSLKTLLINGLFGMNKSDCLLPGRARALEPLRLHNILHGYAAAMRSRWRPEIPNGTFVAISGARRPEWLAENRANPLRDWDGRKHISRSRYAKAVAQYKATRHAIMAALSDGADGHTSSRLAEIGREYGESFNKLDSRTPFIETEEPEELFAALDVIIKDVEAAAGANLSSARESIMAAVEAVRAW
jgi:hypothetical protein